MIADEVQELVSQHKRQISELKHASTEQGEVYAQMLNDMARKSERAEEAERKLKVALDEVATHKAAHEELLASSQTRHIEHEQRHAEHEQALRDTNAAKAAADAELRAACDHAAELERGHKKSLEHALADAANLREMMQMLVQEHESVKARYDEALAELSLFRSRRPSTPDQAPPQSSSSEATTTSAASAEAATASRPGTGDSQETSSADEAIVRASLHSPDAARVAQPATSTPAEEQSAPASKEAGPVTVPADATPMVTKAVDDKPVSAQSRARPEHSQEAAVTAVASSHPEPTHKAQEQQSHSDSEHAAESTAANPASRSGSAQEAQAKQSPPVTASMKTSAGTVSSAGSALVSEHSDRPSTASHQPTPHQPSPHVPTPHEPAPHAAAVTVIAEVVKDEGHGVKIDAPQAVPAAKTGTSAATPVVMAARTDTDTPDLR